MHRKLLVGSLLLCCGCSSMNNTDKGLLAGGGLGAATGAIIGSAVGRPGAGAAIGGGLGAVAGGLTGAAIDRSEERAVQRAAAAQAAQPVAQGMSLQEVAQLAQNRVPDHVIINQIRSTGSAFQLSTDDIVYLQQCGVSAAVITEMQARCPARVVAPAPVIVQPRPVYVVEPPPPVGVGIGFGYCRPRRCW